MSTHTHVSEEATELEPAPEQKPSEWESALLSIALFGGLCLFGLGCMIFGWG